MKNISGILVVLTALISVACGKDKGGDGAGKTTAAAAPDPAALCAHVRGVVSEKPNAEAEKECIDEVTAMKAEFGEELYKKIAECVLASKTNEDLGACDPERMRGESGSGEAMTEYQLKSKATEAQVFIKKLYDGARMFYMML